ncbi:MAG: 2-oxo-4-hydroxy-4-carboxy-5-ureidoimidazoline decarboxylase, partial [Betaproteobacteria bacterium]
MPLSLADLNAAAPDEFVALLAGIYEHSPWVVEGALPQRPFASLAALKRALVETVRGAGRERQLALLRAHPELAGKAMVARTLTAESTREQGRAGLADCTPAEFERLQELNRQYNEKFGWPFILAVGGPRGTGLARPEIIATFARRLAYHPDVEFAECLRNVHRVAELRLADRLGVQPEQCNALLDLAARLARHRDPEFSERGQISVTYLTPA